MLVNKYHFPFDTIREQQSQIIDELNKIPPEKKYIFLQCGTGIGKSALAVTMGKTAGKAYIVSTSKQLQDQYVKDFSNKGLVTMKGRSNYPCLVLDDKSDCSKGPCIGLPEIKNSCKEHCSYYKQKELANKSQLFCTNYAFLLSSGDLKKRDLLVFDEAHNIENEIISFATINIKPLRTLKKVKKTVTKDDYIFCTNISIDSTKDEIIDFVSVFSDKYVLPHIESLKGDIALLNIEEKSSKIISALDHITKELKLFESLYNKITIFNSRPEDYCFETLYDGDDFVIKLTPLNPSRILKTYTDRLANKVLFMSATILDFEIFAESLGISTDESAFLSFESTFNPELSPIYNLSCVDLSYKNLNNKDEIDSLIKTIDFIVKQFPNDKGIIHTGNKTITDILYDHFFDDERFLFRIATIENQVIYNDHITSDKPTILVSSSMLEGVDLSDDLSRFQIVCKLPYLSLGDKRIKMKTEMNNKWYELQMWQRLIQSCGRSTRSENDFSKTFILDRLFNRAFFNAKKRGILPQQFEKRIISK